MGARDVAVSLLGGARERRSWSTTSLAGMFEGRDVLRSERITSVTYDSAQAHAAVFACVDLLCRLTAWQMPTAVLRGDEVVPPAQIIANPHPEPQMTAQHWRSSVLESALLRGFAAGIVVDVEPTGWPRQIMPLHPDDVSWRRDAGRIVWTVGGRSAELWQRGGDLWVSPGLRVSPGSPVGMSAVAYGARQIGLGLGATDFGKGFFDNSATPSGILSVNVPQLSSEQAEQIKRRFVTSAGLREPVVLSQIADYRPLQVAPEESQFLETIKANVATVCMFFGVPPEAIGGSSGDSMTYANVEGRNLSLLTNTVGAWMQWLEGALTSLLPRPQRVELDPEALLRTSVPTLYATAAQAVGTSNSPGLLTVNEARAMLGYGPTADGDRLYVPANYLPADMAGDQINQGGGQNA